MYSYSKPEALEKCRADAGVAFLMAASVFMFTAMAVSREFPSHGALASRTKAEDLLLRRGRIGSGNPASPSRTRLPTPEEATGIAVGTSVSDVVAKLGLPGDSSCLDGGGFTVGYALTHGKSYREWDLRFDARQGFVSAKRRHPGY